MQKQDLLDPDFVKSLDEDTISDQWCIDMKLSRVIKEPKQRWVGRRLQEKKSQAAKNQSESADNAFQIHHKSSRKPQESVEELKRETLAKNYKEFSKSRKITKSSVQWPVTRKSLYDATSEHQGKKEISHIIAHSKGATSLSNIFERSSPSAASVFNNIFIRPSYNWYNAYNASAGARQELVHTIEKLCNSDYEPYVRTGKELDGALFAYDKFPQLIGITLYTSFERCLCFIQNKGGISLNETLHHLKISGPPRLYYVVNQLKDMMNGKKGAVGKHPSTNKYNVQDKIRIVELMIELINYALVHGYKPSPTVKIW
jgi:hypothetical protein